MVRRVAVGSFFIECNHLGGPVADWQAFERTELLLGESILDQTAGTVGGMLADLRQAGVEIVPLVVASACPSGYVTDECYHRIKAELLGRLRRAGELDGVLLALHGSAASQSIGDLEGDLLCAVRATVGAALPIVGSLDHHAHVTYDMMAATDAFVAWDTYPHRDAYETGQRAVRLLLGTLDGRWRPTMAMGKVPVLVSGVLGHTDGPGPFADVMRAAKRLEREPGVISAGAILVHPYLDLPDLGGGGLVVTDHDLPLARRLAADLARQYWARRFDLEPPVSSPAAAIARGMALDGGPVVLVETADCCGGGAAGDSVATLRALLDAKVWRRPEPSLACVVDPAAAAACHAAGLSATVTLDLGHHVAPQWGQSVRVTGQVARLSDGRFTYRGGIWQGRTGEMGPAARLDIGSVQVAIATFPTYEWCGEQYELLDMPARSAKFVVAKNPMNFNLAFGEFARASIILDTPGPTPPTLKQVQYRRLQRPYYPADPEIPGLEPVVLAGHGRW